MQKQNKQKMLEAQSLTDKQFAALSNLHPFSLEIQSNYDIDLSNLKNSTNLRSLDLSYSKNTDFRFITEMQNLEYVKLPSGSELSKELKSKEFTTEGQIAKLKMNILSQ